ncbi:hypothetical protein NQZ68_039376 [Dissostichus eleginoides]|nr:hypothetical protein NQZ68_039376 [Dissostichus eleginoides]
MQLTGLCVQIFELSEKVDRSLALPLTRWPRVRDPDPLSKANANPRCRKEVSPGWSLEEEGRADSVETELLTADTGWARPEYAPLFSNEKTAAAVKTAGPPGAGGSPDRKCSRKCKQRTKWRQAVGKFPVMVRSSTTDINPTPHSDTHIHTISATPPPLNLPCCPPFSQARQDWDVSPRLCPTSSSSAPSTETRSLNRASFKPGI